MRESSLSPAPLLKARVQHTRIFVFAILPLVIFSLGMLADDGLAHEIMEWFGHALVITCVLGRSYCSAYIGGRKNDEIIREGPFSIVRNPLYVFSFLGMAGIGLQSGMVTVLLLLLLGFVLYYPKVVAREEAYLLHKFGDSYTAFLESVPRWWPRWKNWVEPEYISTQPRLLRESMRDAAVFFIAFPIFELLDTLRDHGLLQTYFLLP
ncbi:MAG: isoprenylcysteine carboxylmethyltransferase family protein [Alphaproteobacteria bacterium]